MVEGRLVEPWIGLLRLECADAIPEGPVTLDLSAVTYVGPTGVRLLREVAAEGVRLDPVPGLIQQMLEPDS